VAVDDDQVEHFRARKHLDFARPICRHKRLVSAQQQLLAGLAARVKRARHLRAAEGAVGQQPPYSRANGTPCATHWSMMLTLTCASR
jgi:hypothetical protein